MQQFKIIVIHQTSKSSQSLSNQELWTCLGVGAMQVGVTTFHLSVRRCTCSQNEGLFKNEVLQ